jgi:hypothetical protein
MAVSELELEDVIAQGGRIKAFVRPLQISQTSADARPVKATGFWTMAGTWGILLAISIVSGSLAKVTYAAYSFVTGDLDSIRNLGSFGFTYFSFVAGILVYMLPMGWVFGLVVHAFSPTESHLDSFQDRFRTPRQTFFFLMLLLVGEELFARALFLGLGGMLFTSDTAYYILFFLGNGLWAAVHLYNFKANKDRKKFWLVLPQFVGGVFLTVTFASYGLLAAILAHVAYDMLLFCMDRIDKFNLGEGLVVAYNVVLLALSWIFLDENIFALEQWLSFDGQYTIPGWTFNDYLWAVVFVYAALTIIAELLLYDLEPLYDISDLTTRALGSLILIGIIFGLYWLMGLVVSDVASRLYVITLLIMFSVKTVSGSGLARVFWVSVPVALTVLSACFAVGFWWAVLLMFIFSAIRIPEDIIRKYIDTD